MSLSQRVLFERFHCNTVCRIHILCMTTCATVYIKQKNYYIVITIAVQKYVCTLSTLIFQSSSELFMQSNANKYEVNQIPSSLSDTFGPFANCTYNIVSLLKAWKVTVVRTECGDAAFQRHFFRMGRS